MGSSALGPDAAPPPEVGRTFVISDVHGYPEVIRNAVEHGGFDPACDHLIFAGDVIDRGGGVEDCLELLDRYSATCLLGNHDMAILVGYHIPDQDPENRRFQDLLRALYLDEATPRRWQVVASMEGVVISHAGLTAAHDTLLTEDCGSDPANLATLLNDQARRAVEDELATGFWDKKGVLRRCGPLRFRRFECPDARLSERFEQVVGHSPPSDRLGSHVHMIDPVVHGEPRTGLSDPGRYRYAIIQNGAVRVFDGTLSA
ncbi:MAG: metallophosphoesterase [Thermoleophilia bacterium]